MDPFVSTSSSSSSSSPSPSGDCFTRKTTRPAPVFSGVKKSLIFDETNNPSTSLAGVAPLLSSDAALPQLPSIFDVGLFDVSLLNDETALSAPVMNFITEGQQLIEASTSLSPLVTPVRDNDKSLTPGQFARADENRSGELGENKRRAVVSDSDSDPGVDDRTVFRKRCKVVKLIDALPVAKRERRKKCLNTCSFIVKKGKKKGSKCGKPSVGLFCACHMPPKSLLSAAKPALPATPLVPAVQLAFPATDSMSAIPPTDPLPTINNQDEKFKELEEKCRELENTIKFQQEVIDRICESKQMQTALKSNKVKSLKTLNRSHEYQVVGPSTRVQNGVVLKDLNTNKAFPIKLPAALRKHQFEKKTLNYDETVRLFVWK